MVRPHLLEHLLDVDGLPAHLHPRLARREPEVGRADLTEDRGERNVAGEDHRSSRDLRGDAVGPDHVSLEGHLAGRDRHHGHARTREADAGEVQGSQWRRPPHRAGEADQALDAPRQRPSGARRQGGEIDVEVGVEVEAAVGGEPEPLAGGGVVDERGERHASRDVHRPPGQAGPDARSEHLVALDRHLAVGDLYERPAGTLHGYPGQRHGSLAPGPVQASAHGDVAAEAPGRRPARRKGQLGEVGVDRSLERDRGLRLEADPAGALEGNARRFELQVLDLDAAIAGRDGEGPRGANGHGPAPHLDRFEARLHDRLARAGHGHRHVHGAARDAGQGPPGGDQRLKWLEGTVAQVQRRYELATIEPPLSRQIELGGLEGELRDSGRAPEIDEECPDCRSGPDDVSALEPAGAREPVEGTGGVQRQARLSLRIRREAGQVQRRGAEVEPLHE